MYVCPHCKNTGVIDTGNNDLPCRNCPAGDRALFNIAEVRGLVTGEEVKRHFLNTSPEPIVRSGPHNLKAEDLPGRQKKN